MDSSVIARQILRLCSVRSSFSPIIRLKPTTSAARIAASLRLGVDSVKKILIIIDDLDLVTLKKYSTLDMEYYRNWGFVNPKGFQAG